MAQGTAKKITLKPLGNRVVVKRLEQEEKVKGGICPCIIRPVKKLPPQRRGAITNKRYGKNLEWITLCI